MEFKYWIALGIAEPLPTDRLPSVHQGLTLFIKRERSGRSAPKFAITPGYARIPHASCRSCGRTLKDWGGKKHLMNPAGTALSDVWRDLPRRRMAADGRLPTDVAERIDLITQEIQSSRLYFHAAGSNSVAATRAQDIALGEKSSFSSLNRLELDHVYQGDSIDFLNRISQLHPQGAFDLVFADPPYNLRKAYDKYDDELADQDYLNWCNQWLSGMARTLKPGGSLFVLNLPKWCISHAVHLNKLLDFENWIVWDAPSEPRGKLVPAHYGLLYYTKPGGRPKFNYKSVAEDVDSPAGPVIAPDHPHYCLRQQCVKKRKLLGDDIKLELTDIWSDIHRIKHKRDRDSHPCQLPEKFMERIIRLSTDPGDVVFDPFGGAGTTAIAAKKLARRYVIIDLDDKYVEIARRKLQTMSGHRDLFGNFVLPRASVRRERAVDSKRDIESTLQQLAARLGRPIGEFDLAPEMLKRIDAVYHSRSAALKRAKIALPSPTMADASIG